LYKIRPEVMSHIDWWNLSFNQRGMILSNTFLSFLLEFNEKISPECNDQLLPFAIDPYVLCSFVVGFGL